MACLCKGMGKKAQLRHRHLQAQSGRHGIEERAHRAQHGREIANITIRHQRVDTMPDIGGTEACKQIGENTARGRETKPPRFVEGGEEVVTNIARDLIVRPAPAHKIGFESQLAGYRQQVQRGSKSNGGSKACPFVKLARAIKEDRGGLPIAGLRQSLDRAPAAWR